MNKVLLLLSIVLCTTIGCRTASNPSGIIVVGGVQLNPGSTGKAVQSAAKLGGIAAIQQNPTARPYFLVASTAINSAIAAGNVTPDDIKTCLQLTTTDIIITEMVSDALSLYADYYSQLVTNKLDTASPYTVPVLIGFANGLKQAYDLTLPK